MLSLEDSVTNLIGVGPKKFEALKTLGIFTIEDLLTYYPRRYENFEEQDIHEAQNDEKLTVSGTVMSEPVVIRFGGRKSRLTFRLMVDDDVIMVTFFNQPYLKNQILLGKDVAVYGKWDATHARLTGNKLIKQTTDGNNVSAIYPANKQIKANTIKKLVEQAFNEYQHVIANLIPQPLIDRFHLMTRRDMMKEMHFPSEDGDAKQARRTAAFEEFFLFQLRLQSVKRSNELKNGLVIQYHNDEIKAFISKLPYELTDAQKKVVNEICRDLLRPVQMNRLLQGDVGSGKTIVAAIAIYAAVTAGYQTALMVPTEILAKQHADNLASIFKDTHVNIALLTGSMTTKQHRSLVEQVKSGAVNLIIGTHALIQDSVEYANLGLIVTDEQHRFGVNQRKKLREKGNHPDVLAMTATPIPRTLAITAYGEMDVSIINEMPKGRLPIQTRWIRSNQEGVALEFVLQQLKHHRQAYVVTPLIEQSEVLDVQNAQELYTKLQEYFAPEFKVGLLHGRMENDQKDAIMQQFNDNDIQVLVSTTVIEVGVDVANATLMMIYDADRFGLAQLHQLRGRVGRGKEQSYCLLLAEPKTQDGITRMQIMTRTNDGFVLAQKDLELRGTGDIFGVNQSGMPDFKVGDPINDLNMLQVAQNEASYLLSTPNWDSDEQNLPLVAYLKKRKLQTHFD